jgi:hypothetical protein
MLTAQQYRITMQQLSQPVPNFWSASKLHKEDGPETYGKSSCSHPQVQVGIWSARLKLRIIRVAYFLCESINVHDICSMSIINVVQQPNHNQVPHIGDPDVIRTQCIIREATSMAPMWASS